jgi:6-phosphogluconolactonase/glucosamine-6-phosphate isomerase/deaminase
MEFILTAGWDDGIAALTRRIADDLAAGKRVLWLVSGGSNVKPAARVTHNIGPRLKQNLSVLLADERYGPVGHPKSNWQQLMDAGFDAGEAKLMPVLKKGLDFAKTISHYEQLAEKAFRENDTVIAQLGIGTDGHIAGVLPGSPGVKEKKSLVVGFEYPPLKRMTMTFQALRKVDVAYAFAFGEPKKPALTQLKNEKQPTAKQPAQILKQLPEAYIYNDQVGAHV